MKNIAIIFAGGTGQRMNSKARPKQFLELHGKPILIYTLEQFQRHPEIDGIILISLSAWVDRCKELAEYYRLSKVAAIVPGGKTGQESIWHGLCKAKELYELGSIVLIHDGVRDHQPGDRMYKGAWISRNGSASYGNCRFEK